MNIVRADAASCRGLTDNSTSVSWIKLVAFVLGGLVILWFCVRAMVLGLWEREYPLIGRSMTPPSAVSLALIALNRVSARNGAADPLARKLARDALHNGPLLAEPFIVAGLDASAREDFTRARHLMEEARHRDPRAIIARYWLFDDYLRNGNYAAGIAEVAPLIRIQPATESAAVTVLTALIKVPTARSALVASLRTRPPWQAAFFRQAALSPHLRDDALQLLRTVSPDAAAATGRGHQSMIDAMLAARRYDDAYALWLRTLPADARPNGGPLRLFDGGFTGRASGPPFGWLFASGEGTVATVAAPDAASRSGLAIRVGGNRARMLAQQLVLANSGPIRLTFATRALEGGAGTAGLRVELRCGPKGKALGKTTVESFTPQLAPHTVLADVPARCGAVLVHVSVAPAIEAGSLNVLLTGMTLARDKRGR